MATIIEKLKNKEIDTLSEHAIEGGKIVKVFELKGKITIFLVHTGVAMIHIPYVGAFYLDKETAQQLLNEEEQNIVMMSKGNKVQP